MSLKNWELISTNVDRSFRIFNIRTDVARSPRTGKSHSFYILESHDWVNVIPLISEHEVVLIRQFRHGVRDFTLEIPGGIVEEEDTPKESARRELLEETGYDAGEMIPLGWVYPNPAILNNKCYTFIAKDLIKKGVQLLDDKEDIEVEIRALSEIPSLIKEGLINHSLVLVAFYRFYMEYL